MVEFRVPLSIVYETSGATPIMDVVAALQAADAAIQDAISLLPSLIDGVQIEQSQIRAFPWLIESDGFANQSRSDSSYLPMEVGRYVESPFH